MRVEYACHKVGEIYIVAEARQQHHLVSFKSKVASLRFLKAYNCYISDVGSHLISDTFFCFFFLLNLNPLVHGRFSRPIIHREGGGVVRPLTS